MTIWTQPNAAAYSSHDRISKRLEIEAIAKYVKDGMSVLDVGCGDGETLGQLAQRYDIDAWGFDSSPAMLAVAGRRKGILCYLHDINRVIPLGGGWPLVFDLIYSERCLINLPDWESQRKAIGNIAKALKPGGLYVMLENSWDGLQFINDLREKVGLYRIEPPSHNRYLRDVEIEVYCHAWTYQINGSQEFPARGSLVLEHIDDYSSTYYYLSRVVNAALVAQEGKEPDYDSPINKLALSLPPMPALRGQGRIWLWRKS